jgi:hypothetical protein
MSRAQKLHEHDLQASLHGIKPHPSPLTPHPCAGAVNSHSHVGLTPRDSDGPVDWERKFHHAQKMAAKLTAENAHLTEKIGAALKELQYAAKGDGSGDADGRYAGDIVQVAKDTVQRMRDVMIETERAETAINLAAEQAVTIEAEKDHLQIELELAQEELAREQVPSPLQMSVCVICPLALCIPLCICTCICMYTYTWGR